MKSLFILSLFSLLMISCSETHQDIYNYEKLYLTSSADAFKMSHFKQHVSENLIYINNDSNFNKADFQELCTQNKVKCMIQDLDLNSKDVNTELEQALGTLRSLSGKPALVVSASSSNAALLLTAYAIKVKKASEKKLAQISNDLGVEDKTYSKILELTKTAE